MASVYLSCRYVTAYVSFFCFLCLYALRFNMSVAIVCMSKPPVRANETTGEADAVCGVLHHANQTKEYEFDWDRSMQGYILGSFFYGYIITQLPGGWLADRYGPKTVITVGMVVTIIATFLVPVCARAHVGLVIALRVIMGLGMGVGFPALHSLFSKWAPPMERTRLIAFSHAGKVVGDIVAFFISGILCQYGFDGGWPSVFYLFGVGSIVWLVFWILFVFDSPARHPRISAEEKEYIESSIGTHVGHATSVPWKSIFTSVPMIALIVAHTCDNWGRYTMMTSLPSYMKDVLKFDIEENGLYSALPYVGMFFVAILGSIAADFARTKGVSTTIVRKVMQVLGFLLPSILLIGIGFVDCSKRNVAVVVVILAITLNACCESAYMVNHVDIAPKYAGVMFGITNAFATIPGMLAPVAVGELTTEGTREQWRTVFFICVGFYVLGIVVYTVFGSGEEQDWAKDEPGQGALEDGADSVPLREKKQESPKKKKNGPEEPMTKKDKDVEV